MKRASHRREKYKSKNIHYIKLHLFMKNLLHHFLLVFMCLLCTAQAFGQDEGTYLTHDGIKYLCLSDNTAKVAGYADEGGAAEVVVPETVQDGGATYTVTAVMASAFSYSDKLKGIELPGTVKVIENGAFDGCSALKNVSLGEGLEDIQYNAFGMCSALSSINFPSTLRKIGEVAFFGCGELESVDIPEGVEAVESTCFQSCYMLSSVKLPESLKKIGQYAFSDCGMLTSIKIPEGVTYIGDYAFFFSSMLSELNIPENIEYVGDGAFGYTIWYDEWLAAQPEGLLYLGKVAYVYNGDAPAGTEVVIKDGTIKVAMKAFAYRTGIVSVEMPASVEAVGAEAFKGCGDLKKVRMPEGLRKIDTGTFKDCSALEDVNIPSGVENIGMTAFYGCSSLKSVVIPENVKELGAGVFEDCGALQKIYSLSAEAPEMYRGAESAAVFFDNDVYANATLYIPAGSKVSYLGTGDWGKFINMVEDDNLAVESVTDDARIMVADGSIMLPAGAVAEVYDMAGRKVYCGTDAVIGVKGGMYIVKVNGMVKKVVVK